MICIFQTSTANVNETYRYEKRPIKETYFISIKSAIQMICILQASATNVNEIYGYEKTPMKETCLLLIIFAVQMILFHRQVLQMSTRLL